jgi:uncharacterized protein involved in exopolysaccharide biosynthesis
MPRLLTRNDDLYGYPYPGRHYEAAEYSNRLRNRRRLTLFVSVLAASLLVSLAYTFMRPAVYQSKATLLVTPPVINEQLGDISNSQHVELERQALISHAVLGATLDKLVGEDGQIDVDETRLVGLDEMLDVVPVNDTNLIELIAAGPDKEQLPVILSAWLETYMASHRESSANQSASETADITRQLDEIRQKVDAKRAALEQYRNDYDIVSMERNENRILKRLNGLTDSLNEANQAQVVAQARVSAIQGALAQGRPVGSDRAQASLANLEDRLVGIQEQIAELEREFTPQYMSIDPRIAALVKKKKLLEDKIDKKRREGGDIALAEAQQDLASARQSVSSIQQQLDDQKQKVMEFTTRFAEHEALQEELLLLETQYRNVQQRQVQIEVDKKNLLSQVAVKAYPFLPGRPVYPYYMRDAGISVALSFLLALLSVWFYDFLNRPLRQAAVADIQPVFVSAPEPGALQQVAGDRLPYNQTPRALEQQLPRELSNTEVLAQLEAAGPDTRLLIVCLLSGLNTDAISALRWGDIDLDTDTLHSHNQTGRLLVISPPMRAAIAGYMPSDPDPDSPVWQGAGGEALPDYNLDALISCVAHDAGLTRPSEVTSKTFLHTYLAYLVRKGVKLSDLGKVVGRVPPTVLAAYGVFSPPGSALSLDAIEPVYPALQTFFKTQTGGVSATDQ